MSYDPNLSQFPGGYAASVSVGGHSTPNNAVMVGNTTAANQRERDQQLNALLCEDDMPFQPTAQEARRPDADLDNQ